MTKDRITELQDYIMNLRAYADRKGWMSSGIRQKAVRVGWYGIVVLWIAIAIYSTMNAGEFIERISDVAAWTLNGFYILLTLVYALVVIGVWGMSRDPDEFLMGTPASAPHQSPGGLTESIANQNIRKADYLFLASNNALINKKLFKADDFLTLVLLVSLIYAGWATTAMIVLLSVVIIKIVTMFGTRFAEFRADDLMSGNGVYPNIPDE